MGRAWHDLMGLLNPLVIVQGLTLANQEKLYCATCMFQSQAWTSMPWCHVAPLPISAALVHQVGSLYCTPLKGFFNVEASITESPVGIIIST